jgi:hypothetical protein
MLGNVFAASPPPLFSLIMREYNVNADRVSKLPTYTLLALGISVRATTKLGG